MNSVSLTRVAPRFSAGPRGPGRISHHALWRGLFLLLISLGALMASPLASAADYRFPGNIPAACTGSQGSYTCGALSLTMGDTVTVSAVTTIIVNSALTMGSGVQVNAGGSAANLTFMVGGTTDIGANAVIVANIVGTGVVTIGSFGKLTGNVTTQSAAINIGDFCVVDGSLQTTVAGVVNVGANSHVTGSIGTLSGAINVGASTVIDGSLSTALAGVISIGAGASVGGNISTVSGAINIGAVSKVAGYLLDTIAGAITVGANSQIGGSVATNSGAITLTAGVTTGGSVCTGLAGAITLTVNVDVGGNVRTNAGAITVGSNSSVAGGVAAAVGAVTVATSATVGTIIASLKCPFDPPQVAAAPPVIKSREWRQIFMR